jgi:hypothetical protein
MRKVLALLALCVSLASAQDTYYVRTSSSWVQLGNVTASGDSIYANLPPGSGLSLLNGLSATTQTFGVDSTYSTWGIGSSGSAHTFRFPGSRLAWLDKDNSFSGAQTISNSLSVTGSATLGSVLTDSIYYPAGALTVADSLTVTGLVSASNDVTIGDSLFVGGNAWIKGTVYNSGLTDYPGSVLRVSDTSSHSGGTANAIYGLIGSTETSAKLAIGLWGRAEGLATSASDVRLFGAASNLRFYGSSNYTHSSLHLGVDANVGTEGTGTVVSIGGYGSYLDGGAALAGTVTNGYGMYMFTPDTTNDIPGHSFTNLYGLYINDYRKAGSTNSYAIYTDGGLHRFGDTVNISSGVLQMGGTTAIDASRNATLGTGTFGGNITSTGAAIILQTGTTAPLYLNGTNSWIAQSNSDGNFYITHSEVINALTLAPTTGTATFAGNLAFSATGKKVASASVPVDSMWVNRIVENYKAWGNLYVNDDDPDTVTTASATDTVTMRDWNTTGSYQNTTLSDSGITVTRAGTYRISYIASFYGSTPAECHAYLYVNTAQKSEAGYQRTLATAAQVGSASFYTIISLAANDFVKVRLHGDTAETFYVLHASLNVERID